MADASKAEKLASARKKFKELKKEKKKSAGPSKVDENLTESTPTTREPTPVDKNTNEVPENNQFTDFFNVGNVQQVPALFFDNFTSGGSVNKDEAINFFQNASSSLQEHVNIIEPDPIAETTSPSNGMNMHNSGEMVPQYQQEDVREREQVPLDDNEEIMINLLQPFPPESPPEGYAKSHDFDNTLLQHQLEEKNYELALFLEEEKSKNNILSRKLEDYELQLSKSKLENTNGFEQEINRLRTELQRHAQAVEILVNEKTELTTHLAQLQQAGKEKTSECEELQTRLRASRSRVSDLERELNSLKSEKSQSVHLDKEHNAELELLRESNQKLKEANEEMQNDLAEYTEKLRNNSETTLILQQQISELTGQLSLANIKIQQLTSGEVDQPNVQVEQWFKDKAELEKQVAELNESCKALAKERDDFSVQYQQYIQQLNIQLSNLAGKCEQLQKENDNFSKQEESRIKHISELETQLQRFQNENTSFTSQKSSQELKNELDNTKSIVGKLEEEKSEFREENSKLLSEKQSALSELEKKEQMIKSLQDVIEELKVNQPDSAKLLAIMESDKVAASRAVLQNTQMKKQMEGIEEVVLKLNNDKLELTEKLNFEQNFNRELMEKLQKTEGHLQSLADAIEIKDQELRHLRENFTEFNKQILQSEQLTDRLRHYEAQDHSSHALQTELQETKQLVKDLQEELKKLQSNQFIEDYVERIQELELLNKELENRNHTDGTTEETDRGHDDNWNILNKESAMKHLEQKFLKTMEDIANLTEEKQRLEHIVLQLQGETETIGEYVALYQQQRKLLKQKAIEKDQQLSQLANDRELMKNKLEKLNDLVRQLVLEKGTLPQELLQHHDEMQTNDHTEFCEQHAMLNHEINKITQNVETIDGAEHRNTETAEQIIALLSEIKSSNLVQPTENFHHCPWCSGQLITV